MTSHLGVMVLFALCVSAVFAALLRDEPAGQWRIGVKCFGGLVLGGYLLGWVMLGLFG